jgi:tripartite-type tricarboxylate transporter receptor subunit TctC
MRLTTLILGTVALSLASTAVRSAWPERPIKAIVPYAPGSSPDNVMRPLMQEMAKGLGVAIVIDNRPGASATVGTEAIAKSAPDGYTLGYGNIGSLTTNRFMIAKLPYDPDRDLTLIGMAGAVQNMLAVNNNLPVKTVKDLIALAKKSPGKLVMASGGAGNTGHLGGELFKAMTGTFMLHVPYRGSPAAITDLIGGQADLIFDNLSSVGSHVKSGRVRGIGVSGLKRSPTFPDMPTIAEAANLPGYEATSWFGVVGPANMPADILNKDSAVLMAAINSPAVREKYLAMGAQPVGNTPTQFSTFIKNEITKWTKVVKDSGAKVD